MPPVRLRVFLLAPLKLNGVGVVVERFSNVTALGEINFLEVPVSLKVYVATPVFDTACPDGNKFCTPNIAPRSPFTPMLAVRTTPSPTAGMVQVAAPVPLKVNNTTPEIVPPATVEQPDILRLF